MYRTVTISVPVINYKEVFPPYQYNCSPMLCLTQHCILFVPMKVHDILQHALGNDVCIRLKPRVCSMSS